MLNFSKISAYSFVIGAVLICSGCPGETQVTVPKSEVVSPENLKPKKKQEGKASSKTQSLKRPFAFKNIEGAYTILRSETRRRLDGALHLTGIDEKAKIIEAYRIWEGKNTKSVSVMKLKMVILWVLFPTEHSHSISDPRFL